MEYYKYLRQFVGHRPIILPGSVVLVFDSAGAVLLEQRISGHFGLPGGMMDLGESFETVAIREVKEETNLTIRTLEFFKNYSGPSHHVVLENGDEMYVVTAVFYTTDYEGDLQHNPDESLRVQFFSLDQLPELMVPVHLRMIREFQEFAITKENVLK